MIKYDSGLIDSREYDDVVLLGRILCQLNAFAPLPDTIRVKILKHFEKPKHGQWNTVVHSNNSITYYCPNCGSIFNKGCADLGEYNYCPNCGTDMRGR